MQIRKALQRASRLDGLGIVPLPPTPTEIKSLRTQFNELRADKVRMLEIIKRLTEMCIDQAAQIKALEHEWDLMEAALAERDERLEGLGG
jgi:hypothetical protein